MQNVLCILNMFLILKNYEKIFPIILIDYINQNLNGLFTVIIIIFDILKKCIMQLGSC